MTLSVERGMLVMWPAFVTAACCEIRFQLIGRLFDGNAFSIALVVLAVPVVEAICALALFVATDAVDGWKLLWILFVAAQHAAWLVGYCFFYAMESLDDRYQSVNMPDALLRRWRVLDVMMILVVCSTVAPAGYSGRSAGRSVRE